MSETLNIIFAVLAGGLIALQGAVNSQLGRLLSHPLQAAFISFCVGTVGLVIMILAMKVSFPTLAQISSVSPKLFIGGFLGAIFITANIIFIPKIGVANMLVAVLAGQMVVSLILDHLGLFGIPLQPINISRIVGILLVTVGLVLITRFHP